MQTNPTQGGVIARYTHRCGHLGAGLFYAGDEFASADRSWQEATPCPDCRASMELHLIKDRKEQERLRGMNPSSYPVPPELDDPALPRKGDFFVNDETIVRVERQHDGSYWLRRVPCPGIVYQTWVRDQAALMEFLMERGFYLLRRDLH